jgi:hypothetical protein
MRKVKSMRFMRAILPNLAALGALAGGCVHHVEVAPVEVKPITINVNIRIIDEKLDDFYSFEKKYDQNQIPATNAGRGP